MIHARGTHSLGLGLEEMLLGEDPRNPEALWEKMYTGSLMTGRRGLGIRPSAHSTWPCGIFGATPRSPLLAIAWRPAQNSHHTLRFSSSHGPHTCGIPRVPGSQSGGSAPSRIFRAGEMEVVIQGPYAHNGVVGNDDLIVEVVAACREAVGLDFVMMVDVCYCWTDAKAALPVMKRIEPYDLFFMETPLQLDNVEGYAYLHDHSPIRIAAGELQNGRFEFLDLMDRAKVDVAQPDVGRVGGLTGARRVCDMAEDRGKLIVPHCWKNRDRHCRFCPFERRNCALSIYRISPSPAI